MPVKLPRPFLGQPAAASVDPSFADDAGERARRVVLDLYEYDKIGNDPELNAITDFAAQLCETETALVSLVATDNQHFVARTGLEATSTPRGQSFCQHAMVEDRIMVVRDASEDPRFAANPLVTGPPHIRFYAGAPLVSEEGAPLGALCVIDPEPRKSLTALQRQGLRVLATAVMRRLAARRRDAEILTSSDAALNAIRESERRFEFLADTIPQMAWSTDADGIPDYFNARWYEFTGTSGDEHFNDRWTDLLHPDDSAHAAEVWADAVRTGQPYEVEYRLRRKDGEYRWTLARGLPITDVNSRVTRWFGTNTDIHDTREMAEKQELLSRELSHRIKNIFSVVGGLVNFTSRSNPELKDIATRLTDRINALGRAHNYVRPASDVPADAAKLSALLEDLFAPYDEDGKRRVRVVGDDFEIGERGVTPLALIFHELATNAMKYGSLSNADGSVLLTIRHEGDELHLFWKEENGPSVAAVGERGSRGFGSDLIEMAAQRQLRGTVEYEWHDDGLCVEVKVPTDALK